MNANNLGHIFKFHSFGESHGPAMGLIIDGCPAGLEVSLSLLEKQLNRRKPGKSPWTSSRREKDQIQILSGVFEGKTLGTPIGVVVYNTDPKSGDYEQIKQNFRSGHSEDLWKEKFSHYDYRGGGRSSGRETLTRLIAGVFAQMLVKKLCPLVKVMAFVRQVGPIKLFEEELTEVENLFQKSFLADSYPACLPHTEKSKELKELLIKAKQDGESYGSLVELWIEGLPKALGQPLFNKFKSDLARSFLSLGASTSLEIGLGRDSVVCSGSQFHLDKKNYGGLRGGLSTGDRVCIKTGFKPPSSLGEVSKKGRHDPCIGPRAVPVLEAMAYLILADHLLWKRLDRV